MGLTLSMKSAVAISNLRDARDDFSGQHPYSGVISMLG